MDGWRRRLAALLQEMLDLLREREEVRDLRLGNRRFLLDRSLERVELTERGSRSPQAGERGLRLDQHGRQAALHRLREVQGHDLLAEITDGAIGAMGQDRSVTGPELAAEHAIVRAEKQMAARERQVQWKAGEGAGQQVLRHHGS